MNFPAAQPRKGFVGISQLAGADGTLYALLIVDDKSIFVLRKHCVDKISQGLDLQLIIHKYVTLIDHHRRK